MKNTAVEETPKTEEFLGAQSHYLLTALTDSSEAALKLIDQTIVTAGGTVTKTEDLGVRSLAYPISKKTELGLISVFFSGQPDIIKPIEGELKHEATLVRYLLTSWREDPHKEQPKRRVRTNV